MKSRALVVSLAVGAVLLFALPVQAEKPAGNLASAQKVVWNLSGAVMPVPPYGWIDIPGSDTASKLIVNQPNGEIEVTITGAMNGLHPNTVYTVYLFNPYIPYVYTGWSFVGVWVWRFNFGSDDYDHDVTIQPQPDGTFSGTAGWPAGGPYQITETITGTINAMSGAVTVHSVYDNNGYWYDAKGTIAADGTLSGTWGNDGQGYDHTWQSVSGKAVKTHTGDIWDHGLFTSTVPPFNFTTDAYGAGSWHLNLINTDFPGPGTYTLSVWINEAEPGLTMLISDTFQVTVE